MNISTCRSDSSFVTEKITVLYCIIFSACYLSFCGVKLTKSITMIFGTLHLLILFQEVKQCFHVLILLSSSFPKVKALFTLSVYHYWWVLFAWHCLPLNICKIAVPFLLKYSSLIRILMYIVHYHNHYNHHHHHHFLLASKGRVWLIFFIFFFLCVPYKSYFPSLWWSCIG